MRKPGGYGITSYPWGKTEEEDSFACAHCGRITIVQPFQRIDSFCRRCMKNLCERCSGFQCDPIEQKLGRVEKSGFKDWFVNGEWNRKRA